MFLVVSFRISRKMIRIVKKWRMVEMIEQRSRLTQLNVFDVIRVNW